MNRIDEIQRDIACPKCDYNLRGLAGAVVTCPECGCECDIAKLVARKWTGPWYNVPELKVLTYPAALLWLGIVARFIWGAYRARQPGRDFTMFNGMGDAAFYLALLAGWGWLVRRAWDVFGNAESIAHVLLAHFIIVGYVGGVIGGFVCVINGFGRDTENSNAWQIGAVICLVVAILANRGERLMGVRCIAAHLNRPFRGSGATRIEPPSRPNP